MAVPQKSAQLTFETGVQRHTKLIGQILENPMNFLWNPRETSRQFSEADFEQAHDFFSSQDPSRYVYAVCTALFKKAHPNLDRLLYSQGLSDFQKSRFWPFWQTDTSQLASKAIDEVEDYLLTIWNKPSEQVPSMFYQTGFIEIENRRAIGEFYFFKCTLPVRACVNRRPCYVTIAFDSRSHSFYSLNSRIRFEDPEYRFRYIEFIDPEWQPPDIRRLVQEPDTSHYNVLLVLDRHIGDNLSLFTTHVPYLVNRPNIDLTIDTSLCPLFRKLQPDVISRFFQNSSIKVIDSLVAGRENYDFVFDPYDWTTEAFDLKPQNDSGAITFVSGIEFAQSCLHRRRRDIIDIHMSSLRRMSLAPANEQSPEFIRYRLNSSERSERRNRARVKILRGQVSNPAPKIVTFFPFGLTPERRYPKEGLQSIIHSLLQEPTTYIVLAGSDYDTPEMVETIRTEWPGVPYPCRHRVQVYFNEPLDQLIDLMLGSDAVVAMDSGPLHIARSLRIKPVGLYTGKVNNAEALLSFPWLVEDNTAEVLKPNRGEDHVRPSAVMDAIQNRLSLLPHF